MKTNLYDVVYETSVPQESPDYAKALEETKLAAHLIQAGDLKEALVKANKQKLVLLKVLELKLLKHNINLL